MMPLVAPILVAACGNPNAGDDGFAPAVAGRLASLELPDVDILDLGASPTALLDSVAGRQILLVIDALRWPDSPVGRILELDGHLQPEDDCLGRDNFSSHGWGIANTLAIARRLDMLPGRVRVLGAAIGHAVAGGGMSAALERSATAISCRVILERSRIYRGERSQFEPQLKRSRIMITPTPFEVWSAKTDSRPGALLQTLERLAIGEIDPQFLLVRPLPADPGQMLVLMAPVRGDLERERARRAGFSPDTHWHFVRVEGADEHGTALRVTEALTEVGIHADEMLLSALDSRLVVYLGFESDDQARTAIRRLEHQI